MLCVTGSWDEVIDWMEKYIQAGARTVVLRFAARDQLAYLEACAEALSRRGLLAATRSCLAMVIKSLQTSNSRALSLAYQMISEQTSYTPSTISSAARSDLHPSLRILLKPANLTSWHLACPCLFATDASFEFKASGFRCERVDSEPGTRSLGKHGLEIA